MIHVVVSTVHARRRRARSATPPCPEWESSQRSHQGSCPATSPDLYAVLHTRGRHGGFPAWCSGPVNAGREEGYRGARSRKRGAGRRSCCGAGDRCGRELRQCCGVLGIAVGHLRVDGSRLEHRAGREPLNSTPAALRRTSRSRIGLLPRTGYQETCRRDGAGHLNACDSSVAACTARRCVGLRE